jgi:hypothetical protein
MIWLNVAKRLTGGVSFWGKKFAEEFHGCGSSWWEVAWIVGANKLLAIELPT